MPTTLSASQVESYPRDGFLSPLTALTREEARRGRGQHHTLLLHRSQPNRSAGRRIGLAISCIPTQARHLGVAHQRPAMLVRGTDTFGHFALEPAPVADLDAQARAAYDRSCESYRKAYAEQVALEKRETFD